MTRGRLVLIDASIWIFRSWFGLPGQITDRDGRPANALVGWIGFLLDELARAPEAVGVAFDEALGSGFRHQLYDGYKANRALPDADLARQLLACRRFTESLGLCCAASERFEADDLLASAARGAREAGWTVEIVSRDKDLLQLLRDEDRMRDPVAGREIRVEDVEHRFGVLPEQLPDWLGLAGDAVDGIPGAPGVGPRTATRLLERWTTLEGLYAALEARGVDALEGLRGAPGLATRLRAHRDQVFLCRRLARALDDAPVPFTPWCSPRPRPTAGALRAALAEVALSGQFEHRLRRWQEAPVARRAPA
jgi:5'-3' exonuclease